MKETKIDKKYGEQLNREQAIAIFKKGDWRNWDNKKIVRLQLFQKRLCMIFSTFHKAVEAVLNRPVYNHEFASSNIDNLIEEYLETREPPTIDEIINLIPEGKRIVVTINTKE